MIGPWWVAVSVTVIFISILGLWWVLSQWAEEEIVDYLDRRKGVNIDRGFIFGGSPGGVSGDVQAGRPDGPAETTQGKGKP